MAREIDLQEIHFSEFAKEPLVSRKEAAQLIARMRAGDATAREQLIRANLRFVIKVAKQYRGRGLELQDLVQEGALGLMRAIESFDPSRNVALISYAVYWIRQRIQQAIWDKGNSIRVPVSLGQVLSQVQNARRELTTQLERKPSHRELAKKAGLPIAKVKRVLEVEAMQNIISLNAKARRDAGNNMRGVIPELGDTIEDPGVEPIEDKIVNNDEQAMLRSRIREALSHLDARRRDIICRRFGFNGNGKQTLEEIGMHYGITRERARQLEASALEKLRPLLIELFGSRLPDMLSFSGNGTEHS